MRDPAFPALCALGAVLVLLPLPWHWQARNTGTLIYVGWTFTACIIFMVNSLVWAGNIDDPAPVWCDISSRFVIALSTGLPASSLCVQRRLYRVAAMKEVSILQDTGKKQLIIDLLIGVGLPLMVVILYYVVQPVRYMIIEDIGCWPELAWSVLSISMVRMWSILVGLASFVYAGLTIRAFIKTRRQFSRVLSESGAGLNLSRFFRLMALAGTDMAFSLPLSLYAMITSSRLYPMRGWISWDETHEFIHDVWKIPHVEIQTVQGLQTGYDLNLWAIPGCAFLFFMFFGLSSEAIKQYRLIFWRLVSPFGFRPSEPKPEPEPQNTSWMRRLVPGTQTSRQTETTFARTVQTSVDASLPTISQVKKSEDKIDIKEEEKSAEVTVKDLEAQA